MLQAVVIWERKEVWLWGKAHILRRVFHIQGAEHWKPKVDDMTILDRIIGQMNIISREALKPPTLTLYVNRGTFAQLMVELDLRKTTFDPYPATRGDFSLCGMTGYLVGPKHPPFKVVAE